MPQATVQHRLEPLFNFSSIAHIGASDSAGRRAGPFEALTRLGFTGRYFPVNPRREQVNGIRCYPTVSSIPQAVEAALVVIPAQHVLGAIKDAAEHGTRSFVVISAGFREADEEGARRQAELTDYVREKDLLLVGPNCLGLVSLANHCAAFSSAWTGPTEPGAVAVVSNSGGLLNEVVSYGSSRGLSFTHLLSSGNEAGVTSADAIDFYVSDPATRVVLAVLETVRDPDLFLQAADRAVAARKPLVVLKMGASEKGSRAAQTHTGALAGSDEVYSALFRQKGIVRVGDIDELVDMGVILSHAVDTLPQHRAERVGIIEISGGGKGLFCDTAAAAGVELPEVSPESFERLKDLPAVVPTNPVDTGGSWVQEDKAVVYPIVLDTFASQPDFDIVASRYTIPRAGPIGPLDARLAELVAARAQHPDRLFVVLSRTSDELSDEWRQAIQRQHVAFLPGYGRSLRALARLADYSRFLWGTEPTPQSSSTASQPTRATARVLDEVAAKGLVASAGIPVVPTLLARTVDEAVARATELGFPVALKVVSPQIVHKSDAGGVRLGLQNAGEVSEAFQTLRTTAERQRAEFLGVAVQPMATPGIELVLGAHRDPQFGPVILFGLGGIAVEVMHDVALRVAPIDEREAATMLTEIRAHALLEGARGRPLVDRAALADALTRISDLMLARPDITGLDLNPVFAYPDGLLAVDARVELRRE